MANPATACKGLPFSQCVVPPNPALQKIAYAENRNPGILAKPQQVPVSTQYAIRSGFGGALEDSIVRGIFRDDMNRLLRFHHSSEGQD
jgi:hypothetical protein